MSDFNRVARIRTRVLAIGTFIAVLAGTVIIWRLSDQLHTPHERTIWEGVYTREQAADGRRAYVNSCTVCHWDDLRGANARLRAPRFTEDWREDHLDRLFSRMKATMPATAPGSLSDLEYLDLIAYVLHANGLPPGLFELKRSQLAEIRIEKRDGPHPLAERTPVETAGCFVERAPDFWELANAVDISRSHSPMFDQADLIRYRTGPDGSNAFPLDLMDFAKYRIRSLPKASLASVVGRRVAIKAAIARDGPKEVLRVEGIEPLGPACPGR